MKTELIVAALSPDAKARFLRVRHQLEPLPQDGAEFVLLLHKYKRGASVAYGRAGNVGDCEQTFFDYAVVLDAAEDVLAQAQQAVQADSPAFGGPAA